MNNAQVTRHESGFAATDGARITYRAWELERPRCGLVLVHGLGEHGGRYEATALRLAAAGVSTYAIDQRGHGRTAGPRGHVASFDVFLDDIIVFSRLVRERVGPAVPLFVFGQSMGGLVVLRFLEEHPAVFDAGVIVSPWLGTALPVPRWKSMLVGPLSRVLPWLPFASGLPPEDLSHDPVVVEKYRDDPLVHDRITPRLFDAAARAMRLAFDRHDRIRGPVLFMLAGEDKVVNTARALEFTKAMTAVAATVRVYPGHYHEVLNEPGPEAMSDLIGWLDTTLRDMAADHADPADADGNR